METANKVVCNDAVCINNNGHGAGLNVEEVDELHAGIPADRHLAIVPFGVTRTIFNKVGYIYVGLLNVNCRNAYAIAVIGCHFVEVRQLLKARTAGRVPEVENDNTTFGIFFLNIEFAFFVNNVKGNRGASVANFCSNRV